MCQESSSNGTSIGQSTRLESGLRSMHYYIFVFDETHNGMSMHFVC
jgi:hypothetical protein